MNTDGSIPVARAATSKTESARALFHLRQAVLEDWIHRVRSEVQTADTLVEPVIIDTIPLFIDALADALCEEAKKETATESSNFAQEHGGERARVTRYGPEQVLQEYQILKEVVLFKLSAIVDLSPAELSTIQKSFDSAIRDSMVSYFLVQGRIREQLVAALTHDIQNPLGAVQLAADLLNDALEENDLDEARTLSIQVSEGAKRIERIVRDLLDSTVVQVGERQAIEIREGGTSAIVRAALREFSTDEQKRIVNTGEDVVGFWDGNALSRAVEKLVRNALRYGIQPTPIAVTVRSINGRTMISVNNQGPVIPAQNIESLFQAFRRAEAKKGNRHGGWGLGLALARSTAERLGGSLGVESRADTGTTFTIDIPLDSRPFQDAPTSTTIARG